MTWRPSWRRQFRVGAMRERVQLQTATEAVDDAGQTVRTWTTTYANEPAQRVPMRGGEGINGGQVEAGIDEMFIIHFRESVTPQMRLVHGSRTYGIVYVSPVEGGRRYLELSVKAVV